MRIQPIPFDNYIDIRVMPQDPDKILVHINFHKPKGGATKQELEAARDTLSPFIVRALDADTRLGCAGITNECLTNPNGAGLTVWLKNKNLSMDDAYENVTRVVKQVIDNMKDGPEAADIPHIRY